MMLENIMFSLNSVLPFFLLILTGAFLKWRGVFSAGFFKTCNTMVYRMALPVQLFMTILNSGGRGGNNGFVLYITAVTLISFFLIWLITELLWKDKTLVGTLVQGGFRGNFALVGIPLVRAVMGEEAVGVAAVVTIAVVLSYNILSVLILSVRGNRAETLKPAKVVLEICKNPLIISSVSGLLLSLTGFRLPVILSNTGGYISQMATPMGLLSIGGLINLKDATARLVPALYSSVIKVGILPLVFIPLSVFFGYRGAELVTLLAALATPVAISSYAMAVEIGGDGPTASNILVITTFGSAFALAIGVYLLKSFALI